MAVKIPAASATEQLNVHVARLGAWVVGTLADGPADYGDHVLDMHACVAELRKL